MNEIDQLLAAGKRTIESFCYWHQRRTTASLGFSDDFTEADIKCKAAEAEIQRIAALLRVFWDGLLKKAT